MSATPNAAEALVALSQWIDAGNAHRDPEAVTWGRIAKITEEAGEVIEAFIGATGQNPRKGETHSLADVCEELLDVAVTALGALEHLSDHHGLALEHLEQKILRVAGRAGVTPRRGWCMICGRVDVALDQITGYRDRSDKGESARYPVGYGCEVCS
jgi:NTP pyrophosphatase (non-canonical NTP hydrolase)